MNEISPNSTQEYIEEDFLQLARSLKATEDQARKWMNTLIECYTESQRHYHTLEHISSMLQCLKQNRQLVYDEDTLKLAIYFHDIIYEPKASDNEVKSIDLFMVFAADLNLDESVIARVARYVECTISHSLGTEENDTDLKLFLDFDLEVLSRDKAEYKFYSKQIREEYGHLSSTAYSTGRARVLKSFLERERVYFSDEFCRSGEQNARSNLASEIFSLERHG